MITVERLDTIEQDLKWARDNADRSAQTRLFIHHVPFLLTILRPVAEELDAQIAEEEEYLAELEEEQADSESETETVGLVSKVQGRVQEFLSPSDDGDATDAQSTDDAEDAPELVSADEATDAPEGTEETTE